jgi:hypothetical protein
MIYRARAYALAHERYFDTSIQGARQLAGWFDVLTAPCCKLVS